MNTFLETTLAVCGALAAVELLRRLCPEDSVARFAGGLAALYLLASGAAALFSLELDLKSPGPKPSASRRNSPPMWKGATSRPPRRTGRPMCGGFWRRLGLSAKEIRVKTDRKRGRQHSID